MSDVVELLKASKEQSFRRLNGSISPSNPLVKKVRRIIGNMAPDDLINRSDEDVAKLINERAGKEVVDECTVAFLRMGDRRSQVIPESKLYSQARSEADSICRTFKRDIKQKMKKILTWEDISGVEFISKAEKMFDDVEKMYLGFKRGIEKIMNAESEIIHTCATRLIKELRIQQEQEPQLPLEDHHPEEAA